MTRSEYRLFSIFVLFYLFSTICPKAQPQLLFYNDLGKNNVSGGPFIKAACLNGYRYGQNYVEAGFLADIRSNNSKIITGYRISGSRELLIRSTPLDIQAFFMLNPFSDLIRETNWGLLFGFKGSRYEVRLGTNFRTYSPTRYAVSNYTHGSDMKIRENLNLMYLFTYFLKPLDNQWNIGLSVTNADYFIINQETNPVLYLRSVYNLSSPVCLFAEAWYKSAGALNLSVNHFGFHFRTGIIWRIT